MRNGAPANQVQAAVADVAVIKLIVLEHGASTSCAHAFQFRMLARVLLYGAMRVVEGRDQVFPRIAVRMRQIGVAHVLDSDAAGHLAASCPPIPSAITARRPLWRSI